MLELRSVIARVAFQFDLEFAPEEQNGWRAFEEKTLDGFTSLLAPLHITFNTRK